MHILHRSLTHRPAPGDGRSPALASERHHLLPLAMAGLLAATPLALAHHEGDIALAISEGRIATFETLDPRPVPRRVFGATLGEFGIPGVGDEPGFDNPPGTFEPGSLISFTIEAPLMVWSGDGFETTSTDPLDGVRMKLSFASLSATTANGPVAGFPLAVAPNGEWHVHYIFELLPAPGEPEVPPGAYLLELSLDSTQEGVGASEPFWILFNHELEEKEFSGIFELAEELLGDHHHTCPADLDRNGVVDGADLGLLLGQWGSECGRPDCAADLNDDGSVDGADLGILLGAWGECD